MTDVQDDDQWLYGDEGGEKEAPSHDKDAESTTSPERKQTFETEDKAACEVEHQKENINKENEEGDEKDGKGAESSDEDDLTVTIGELKKASEVVTPGQQQHQARFQPKTAPVAGLRDEDFVTAGKINGVSVAEFSMTDSDDKPWRKPGADQSDYFNYGFTETTWFKYCDRQKHMRLHESGTGLASLGYHASKPFGPSSSSDVSKGNSKENGNSVSRKHPVSIQSNKRSDPKSENNTIQVMTAERREYSSKVHNNMVPPSYMTGPPPPLAIPPYDDMEFGGSLYAGGHMDNGYYGPPVHGMPGPFYPTPPPGAPFNPPPGTWNNPPPPLVPTQPPPVPPPPHAATGVPPPPRWGGEVPPSPNINAMRRSTSPFQAQGFRDRGNESDEERHRLRRHRRSRSPSPRGRHRSRSRSPGYRHKRKKSKRDRDGE